MCARLFLSDFLFVQVGHCSWRREHSRSLFVSAGGGNGHVSCCRAESSVGSRRSVVSRSSTFLFEYSCFEQRKKVADCVAEAFANEHFLILPHKQVAKYISIKSRDYEKWILTMKKMRKSML
jgi:hypothetical protein